MKTVLLTAVGSASAAAMIESFHQNCCKVVGTDIYPQSWNASCGMLDDFLQIAPASDKSAYLSQLEAFCRQEKAQLLFPLTDVECDLLCHEKDRFAPCIVATQEPQVQALCRNKTAMAQLLEEKGLARTIPSFSPYTQHFSAEDFPLMLKPVSGRSSQGQVIAQSQADVAAALLKRDDYIAQPFLDGHIFTVELARDAYGNSYAAVREELLRTGNGLGTTVRVYAGHELEDVCRRIAEEAGIVGCVNMEFIHHEGEYYFLEVNPRFSGGLGFLICAGVDWGRVALDCAEGRLREPERPVSGIYSRAIQAIRTTEINF